MEEIVISTDESERLSRSLEEIDLGSPYEDLEEFLLSIFSVWATLPKDVLRRLRLFRDDPESYGALVLRNLPVDDSLPPTPLDGRPVTARDTFVSEASILGIAQILGQPMGYLDENEGDIIQALAPVREEAKATSSESSKVDLDFHTDFSFDRERPDRPYNVYNPDYILLLGLRSDRNKTAKTLYADARDICKALTPAQLADGPQTAL